MRSEHRNTYTEVVLNRRLAYRHAVDFIPGASPLRVMTGVDLEAGPGGVRMVLTFDTMHDEEWTRMATMGWESELAGLAHRLEARAQPNRALTPAARARDVMAGPPTLRSRDPAPQLTVAARASQPRQNVVPPRAAQA